MRPLSPIRSVSPNPKLKITFNYQASPLKERPQTKNLATENLQQTFSNRPSVQLYKQKHNAQIQKPDAFANQNGCFHCSKSATYKIVHTNNYCCSTCAINEMKHGAEVVRLELRDQKFYQQFQEKYEKQNIEGQMNQRITITSPRSKMNNIKKSRLVSREEEIDNLINDINNQEKELQKMLEEFGCNEYDESGIKERFKNKKIALKRHYQKIKEAIKISIEKDLEELDKRQKEVIVAINNKKNEIGYNLEELKKIKIDIQPNRQQIITTVDDEVYRQYMTKYKCQTQKIIEQKQESCHLLSQLSTNQLISDESDQSIQVKLTKEDLELSKPYLYDSEMYTMYKGKKDKRSELLFSFERK